MSSPTEAAGGEGALRTNDFDAAMEDANTQELEARQTENVDHEMAMQIDTQQPSATATGASGLAHHNRKDVSLREFLSKMDDYAPIVGSALLQIIQGSFRTNVRLNPRYLTQ